MQTPLSQASRASLGGRSAVGGPDAPQAAHARGRALVDLVVGFSCLCAALVVALLPSGFLRSAVEAVLPAALQADVVVAGIFGGLAGGVGVMLLQPSSKAPLDSAVNQHGDGADPSASTPMRASFSGHRAAAGLATVPRTFGEPRLAEPGVTVVRPERFFSASRTRPVGGRWAAGAGDAGTNRQLAAELSATT